MPSCGRQLKPVAVGKNTIAFTFRPRCLREAFEIVTGFGIVEISCCNKNLTMRLHDQAFGQLFEQGDWSSSNNEKFDFIPARRTRA